MLINPRIVFIFTRQRWSSTTFSSDLSLLAWRSNIRNVPHRLTSCISQQYQQHMCIYFQLFTDATVCSYSKLCSPPQFQYKLPSPLFLCRSPSPPPVNFMWNINPCCFLPDHIIRGFALLTPGFHFLQVGLKKGRGRVFLRHKKSSYLSKNKRTTFNVCGCLAQPTQNTPSRFSTTSRC
jgi:hypothetical protein